MDQLSPIVKFACAVIEQGRNDGYPGDVDGGWLHDAMVDMGLLRTVKVTEPCDDTNCPCAESDDFPQECYRLTPDMVRLMSVFYAERKAKAEGAVPSGRDR